MKNLRYIIAFVAIAFASCRDLHDSLMGDSVLAEVDGNRLMHSELRLASPREYQGEDSVAFAEVFIEKWILRQVKLREAESIFVSSVDDIEAMVEDYRQLLLIKKLDERCVSASVDTTYTEHQISRYYQDHANNFRLSRDIVKAEVLRIPLKDDQTKKLKKLMESSSESSRLDMLSICEKYDFAYTDLTTQWVESNQLLDLLPLVRGANSNKLLSDRGVNHMKDENYDYFYRVLDHKGLGDISPLEWVRSTIRTILITERQQELIRRNEQQLFSTAQEQGVVKRQYLQKEIENK